MTLTTFSIGSLDFEVEEELIQLVIPGTTTVSFLELEHAFKQAQEIYAILRKE